MLIYKLLMFIKDFKFTYCRELEIASKHSLTIHDTFSGLLYPATDEVYSEAAGQRGQGRRGGQHAVCWGPQPSGSQGPEEGTSARGVSVWWTQIGQVVIGYSGHLLQEAEIPSILAMEILQLCAKPLT